MSPFQDKGCVVVGEGYLGFPPPLLLGEEDMAGNYGGNRGQGRFNRGGRSNFKYQKKNQSDLYGRNKKAVGEGDKLRFSNSNPPLANYFSRGESFGG